MRQQSQKFSIKDDQQKMTRLTTSVPHQKTLQHTQDQGSLQQLHPKQNDKQHDATTQMIYDLMNFQNKPLSNASRQLNLKIPLVQKHILANTKAPNQTHQGNLFNQVQGQATSDDLQATSNVPQASQTTNTGQFFRQAALTTLHKSDQTTAANTSNHEHQTQNVLHSTGFDISEKSTTAATAFPNLPSKGSSFHRKRPSQTNDGSQQINQQTQLVNMPTISGQGLNLQVQKGRGLTKLGRRYKALGENETSQQRQSNFHTPGEILGQLNQVTNPKTTQRQSNERPKIHQSQQMQQSHQNSSTHHSSTLNQLNFLALTQQPSDEPNVHNISPSSTIQFQRRLNGAENQHLNFHKIGNQIQSSFQQAVSSQISINHNPNESQDNSMSIRDIKIRKVHPQQKQQKITKSNGLRFQTAQQILDTTQLNNNQNSSRQIPLQKKVDTSMHLNPIQLPTLNSQITHEVKQNDDEGNQVSSDNEQIINNELGLRRRSDSEQEIKIYKTLNLEERKRLIKQHQKFRRYVDDQSHSQADESSTDKIQPESNNVSIDIIPPQDLNKKEEIACLDLDVIEEETAHNEEVKSQVSRLLLVGKDVSKSIQTHSSGPKVSDLRSSNQMLPIINRGNSTQASPIISKFKKALQSSESFNLIYKKIKDRVIAKGGEEYERLIDNMCKISGLTIEETEICIDQLQRAEFREKFQNPYYKQSVSSQDSIEENLPSISLNHSFSLVNVGFNGNIGGGYSRQPSNSGSSNWTQQYNQAHQGGIMGSNGGQKNKPKQRASVRDSLGNFSGQLRSIHNDTRSIGQSSAKQSQISKKSSEKGKSEFGGSQKSNGLKKNKSNGTSNPNNVQSSGSQHSNELKSVNILTSNGGGSSDSHKAEAAFKENLNGRNNIIEKGSKSQVRQDFFVAEPRKPGLTLEMLKQNNRGQSIQPPQMMFNDVLSGHKAPFAEKNQNLIQGNLIKWKELKKIGQGTSGEVFLAQNIKNQSLFVVKKLNLFTASMGVDKESVMRLKVIQYLNMFQKEIEVYRRLDHENIVKYIGSEIVNNQFCIYLEYLSGGSIQSIYLALGKLPEETINSYTRQILQGLIYLHQNRIVHCDLKGANVLVDQTGVAKLTDFGSAKLFENSISHSEFNGIIRGSLAWMAPEVLMNKGVRRKADIWSLGCLILEMTVAGNPWGNEIMDNYFQAMMKVADPNKMPNIPGELSDDCKDFIKKCLTRDYSARPTSLDLWAHPWIQNSIQEAEESTL